MQWIFILMLVGGAQTVQYLEQTAVTSDSKPIYTHQDCMREALRRQDAVNETLHKYPDVIEGVDTVFIFCKEVKSSKD